MGIIDLQRAYACARIRRRILATESRLHPLTPEREALECHVRECEVCRDFLAEHRGWQTLGSALQRRERGATPLPVRERLFRALALARIGLPARCAPPRNTRLAVIALSVVTVITALLIGFTGLRGLHHAAQTPQSIVEDHWRELHRAAIDSQDPATIQQWLSQRLSIPVHVMRFEGATLEGARLCFVDRRAGAVMIYRLNNELLSYFVMPADSPAQRQAEADALQQHAEQGYNVVAWRMRGLQHALVSALPAEHLRPLADACRARQRPDDGAPDGRT